ncbi:MAG: hypothetical protein ACRD1H_13480 [Vicinamibacterales bacterium]
MDSSFNRGGVPETPSGGDTPAQSPATERFLSCRWRKPAENGTPDHCTHRDVLPMAGTAGFVPDSWCADCSFYKAKRTPRKRQEETATDEPWRRW